MSKESKLRESYSREIIKLEKALSSARDLLVMCTLLDKSGQCNEEVKKIDKILGL